MATICSTFPIYSQTFVHQELTQLAHQGSDVRVIYSECDSRDFLSPQHSRLWEGKRRLLLNTEVQRRDLAHYRARMAEKIDRLVGKPTIGDPADIFKRHQVARTLANIHDFGLLRITGIALLRRP